MCIRDSTTTLLGNPLFGAVLESIGRTTESIFFVHKDAELAEKIHAIDEDVQCLPVESKTLTGQIAEAIKLAESLHLLKEKTITIVPLEYLFTVPVIPYLPEENAILCHPGRVGFAVSIGEEGKVVLEGEELVGSLIHFVDVEHLKSVCSGVSLDSWGELIKHMMEEEEDEFTGIAKVGTEVIPIGTEEDRAKYEAYVHRFVFALDGVVANFTELWYSVWSQTLATFHIQLTNDLYRSIVFGNSDEHIATSLGLPVDVLKDRKSPIVLEEMKRGRYEFTVGFDRVVDLLQRRGHLVQIYSNWSKDHIELVLNHLQIPTDLVVDTLEDGISKERTVVFESRQEGIQNAMRKEVKWVVGCPSYYSAEQLIQMGVHLSLIHISRAHETG
jgi:beta-phosphoglucomutase-like phosphatase (HAD superfamily)